jgi:hypothetical protein
VLRRSKVEAVVVHGVSLIVYSIIYMPCLMDIPTRSIDDCFDVDVHRHVPMAGSWAMMEGWMRRNFSKQSVINRQPEVNTNLKTARSSSKHFSQTFTSIQTHSETPIHSINNPRAHHGFPRRQVQSASAESLSSDSRA